MTDLRVYVQACMRGIHAYVHATYMWLVSNLGCESFLCGHYQPREMPTSMSFEGCGAAISYHLAAYESACRVYGRQKLKNVKFVGTSSGVRRCDGLHTSFC